MCLSCGYISHDQPPQRVQAPDTVGVVTIEQTLPAGTIIDGPSAKPSPAKRAAGAAVRMVQPQINPDVVMIVDQIAPPHKKSPKRAVVTDITAQKPRKAKWQPIGIVVTSVAVAALVGVFVITSLHLNQQLSTVSPAELQTSLVAPPKVDAAAQQRDLVRKHDLTEMATALQVYHAQTGSYPPGTTLDALFALLSSNPSYLNQLNHDPLNVSQPKRDYQYSSDGKTYILRAQFENTNDPAVSHGWFEIKN